jgi:hypothetical protein
VLLAGLSKLLFGGDLETFLMICSPALTGLVIYFWKGFSFVVEDQREDIRLRYTHWRAKGTLKRLQKGTTRELKDQLGQDIDYLDRLFAASVKERAEDRLKKRK